MALFLNSSGTVLLRTNKKTKDSQRWRDSNNAFLYLEPQIHARYKDIMSQPSSLIMIKKMNDISALNSI